MSYIETQFTPEQLGPVRLGIRTFIRLIGMFADPIQGKWIAEEQDLIAALQSIKTAFNDTTRMIGKRKYQGREFDPINEVKKDLMVYLLTGLSETEDAGQRRRFKPMYYLVVEPTIDLFAIYSDHQTMLQHIDCVIDDMIALVQTSVEYGTYDDALIAQEQVRVIIHQREAIRKEQAAKRKPRKSKKELLMEILIGINDTDDIDEVTA